MTTENENQPAELRPLSNAPRRSFIKRNFKTAFAVALALNEFRIEANAKESPVSSPPGPDWYVEIAPSGFETEKIVGNTIVLARMVTSSFDVDFDHQPPFPLMPKARADGRTYKVTIVATPAPRSLTSTEFADGTAHFLYSAIGVTFQVVVEITGFAASGVGNLAVSAGTAVHSEDHTLTAVLEVPGGNSLSGWITKVLSIDIPLPDKTLTLEIQFGAEENAVRAQSISLQVAAKARLVEKHGEWEAPTDYTGTATLSVSPTFDIFQGKIKK